MAKKKLTRNQQIFVDEYLIDRNGTRAYKAAYKTCKKDETARVNASRLLTKANIQDAVESALAAQQERTQITADKVLKELARIGFSDLRKAFDENGRLRRPEEWDDDTAAAMASIEVVTRALGDGEVEYIHKIKSWDKKGALELLGKHLKLFTEKHEHSGEISGGVLVVPGQLAPETWDKIASGSGDKD